MGLRTLATTAAVAATATVALQANPSQAATIIFTSGTVTTFGSSPLTNSFTANGITATFSQPGNVNGNAFSRSVPVGETTMPLGGTCLGGQRPTGVVCGNAATSGAELNSIRLTFNKDVYLNSADIVARTNVNDSTPLRLASSTWVSGTTTRQFEYEAPTTGSAAQAFRLTNYTSAFNNLFAQANTPIVITSSMFGSIDYWLSSITVTDPTGVPGPLPALGAFAAFGFSRRLRNKIKLASK